MTRAVLYLRQSLDTTGEALGIERQREQCERLCSSRGWDVTQVVVDNSVSASKGDRPGWNTVLGLIERQAVDVVVVLRVDRLLRKLTDLEDLITLSERTGVQVATVEGDLDLSSPSGRLVGRLLASVARAEVETKGARHRLALEQSARAGKPRSSRRPYGYQRDLVHIHEPEAVVLREMARRLIAGHSYTEIAYWLNLEGHLTSEGATWVGFGVRNVLRKPRYAGIRTYKGVAVAEGQWEPIFDSETWERLQLAIKLRTRAPKPGQVMPRKFLLTGLLYCGNCGSQLTGSTRHDKPGGPKHRVYQCRSNGDRYRGSGCGGVRRNADALDHFITECVFYRLDTPELSKLLSQDKADDGALSSMLADRAAQQQRVDALVDDYATGLLSKEQLVRAKSSAEAELRRIEEEIDRFQKERYSVDLPAGQTIRQAWELSESAEWRRSLLALVIKRIEVNKRPEGEKVPFYVVNGKRMRFAPELIDVTWMA